MIKQKDEIDKIVKEIQKKIDFLSSFSKKEKDLVYEKLWVTQTKVNV